VSGARDYRLPRDALINARLRNAGLAPCCLAGEEMIFKPDLKEVILNTRPADLIGYWPLDEQRNNRAHDYAGQRRNGTHVGVDLAKPGVGDGRTAPYYDGATDYTNIYSASLAAAFNGNEGTLGIFARVAGAGVWTDGTQRSLATLRVDANNQIYVFRSPTNNRIDLRRVGGGTAKVVSLSGLRAVGWMLYTLTWSVRVDAVRAYLNGQQRESTLTSIGTWVGALNSTLTNVGAFDTTPTFVWFGYLAHGFVYRSALSPSENYNIALAAGLAAA